jgi:hypothetical protein
VAANDESQIKVIKS